MGMRRKGRELALQVLYQLEITRETSEQALHAFAESFESSARAREFTSRNQHQSDALDSRYW